MGLVFGVGDVVGVFHDDLAPVWLVVFLMGGYAVIRMYLNIKRGLVPIDEERSRVVISWSGWASLIGGAIGVIASLVMIIAGATGGVYLGILSVITLGTSFLVRARAKRTAEPPIAKTRTGFASVSTAGRAPVRPKRKSRKSSTAGIPSSPAPPDLRQTGDVRLP